VFQGIHPLTDASEDERLPQGAQSCPSGAKDRGEENDHRKNIQVELTFPAETVSAARNSGGHVGLCLLLLLLLFWGQNSYYEDNYFCRSIYHSFPYVSV
jgi:hypothetical protein